MRGVQRRRLSVFARGQALPPLSTRWALVTACVTVALTFFAIFRIDLSQPPVVSFRHQERWRSDETLLLSRPGLLPRAPRRGVSPSGLWSFYAQIAASAQVRQLALRAGPLHGDYRAFVSRDDKPRSQSSNCNQTTQLASCTSASISFGAASLVIEATARTKRYAIATAARVSRGLRDYVHQQQDAASIPADQRIRLAVVRPATSHTERIDGRRIAGPSVTLAAVLVLLTVAVVSGRRSRPRQA